MEKDIEKKCQGASRVAPGKSGLHARGEGERVLALESREEKPMFVIAVSRALTSERNGRPPENRYGGRTGPSPLP